MLPTTIMAPLARVTATLRLCLSLTNPMLPPPPLTHDITITSRSLPCYYHSRHCHYYHHSRHCHHYHHHPHLESVHRVDIDRAVPPALRQYLPVLQLEADQAPLFAVERDDADRQLLRMRSLEAPDGGHHLRDDPRLGLVPDLTVLDRLQGRQVQDGVGGEGRGPVLGSGSQEAAVEISRSTLSIVYYNITRANTAHA